MKFLNHTGISTGILLGSPQAPRVPNELVVSSSRLWGLCHCSLLPKLEPHVLLAPSAPAVHSVQSALNLPHPTPPPHRALPTSPGPLLLTPMFRLQDLRQPYHLYIFWPTGAHHLWARKFINYATSNYTAAPGFSFTFSPHCIDFCQSLGGLQVNTSESMRTFSITLDLHNRPVKWWGRWSQHHRR